MVDNMAINVKIQKDILIPAAENPDDHSFYYTINPSYTSTEGLGMVMTSVRWISKGNDDWRDRKSIIQRMRSEDNGACWTKYGPEMSSDTLRSNNQNLAPHHFLDHDNGLLLSIHQITRPKSADGTPNTSLYYEISKDQGKTWGPAKPIICKGSGFDQAHWMPGVNREGRYSGVDQPKFAKLDDGTIVFGLTLLKPAPRFPDEQLYDGVVFLRGTWSHDKSEITWEAGKFIRVPSTVSPYGVDEPDLIHLGGQRLLTTMRCEGLLEPLGIFSSRQWATSEDGGRTWSDPKTLCYEDGSMVCVPASLSAFEKHPRTGKIYWFSNIQDRPITGSMPRYPLTMAELDPNRICILKHSVTVIQDLPKGAPANRTYSNFGHYVDRVTGEFVLMMAEKPLINDRDFRADSVRFRIHVLD